jgi:hypothetical protein
VLAAHVRAGRAARHLGSHGRPFGNAALFLGHSRRVGQIQGFFLVENFDFFNISAIFNKILFLGFIVEKYIFLFFFTFYFIFICKFKYLFNIFGV